MTIQHIYLDDFGPDKPQMEILKFPGGEFHPNVDSLETKYATNLIIYARLKSGDDIMKLLTVW